MTYIERALKDGYIQLIKDGNQEKIIYKALNHKERYDDPEEKVRAEFWAELIYLYHYDPQYIGIEVTVPDRVPNDRADIIIFRDDQRKTPYAVIECKRDGISDAEFNQAVEQAVGNGTAHKFRALYAGVVAGNTRRFLDFSSEQYGILERETNIIADLPQHFGRPEVFRYRKDDPNFDIKPVSQSELTATIAKCHQTLWGGGRLSPPAAFGELCKIIFVKIKDELVPRRKGDPYDFQIKTYETSRNLAERIRALYDKEREREKDVFTDTIRIDDQTLRTIVSHLEGINLSKTDLDVKGVAFEQFMDGFFKGNFGQYFTPRTVIQFIVKMIDPQHNERIIDPACGSGGFLLYALDAVRTKALEYYKEDTVGYYRYWHDFASNNLFGMEINDEITRVAKMNMILHDDGHTNVIGTDGLERFDVILSVNPDFKPESMDVALSNPPFGSDIALAERPYLPDYELGRQSANNGKTNPRKNQKSEIIFLERIWQFLKPGGRAAIVVPDGILTNSTTQYVRDWLLEHFLLSAVISLPQFAFAHYGAGVKPSVIFVVKLVSGEIPSDDDPIFMAAPEKIGYDATGRKTESDLDEVYRQYKEFQRNPNPFFV